MFFIKKPTEGRYIQTVHVRFLMYVSEAGHQIDKENLHSKLPFFTATYLQISTLLDIIGKCGNFFALWSLCVSERKKIEAALFMFFVLPKFHFHAECCPGGVVNMTWQSPKRAEITEWLLIRCICKVLLHQPLQLFILLSKNDHFLMHPLKNHPVNTLKQIMAFFKIKLTSLTISKCVCFCRLQMSMLAEL